MNINHKHWYKTYLFRKITSVITAASLLVSVAGCSVNNFGKNINKSLDYASQSISSTEDNSDFASFTKELFHDALSGNTLNIHSYIEHPENYGFENEEVSLGRYDMENLDDTTDIVNALTKLKSFNRMTLSESQQITYDELKSYLENQLEYSDLYLFNTQLSTTIGIQVELPLILSEYTIAEEKDVIEYIELLNDADAYFQNLVDFETLRSKNGYFMEDKLANDIISQCETFVDNASDGYMITTFDERIDALDGLSQEKKNNYKQQNITAVNEHLIKGYHILINGLKSLLGTNQYKGGLCNYPNGSKYYEYLLKNSLGWSKSVDELNDLINSYIKTNIYKMQSLIARDSSLVDKFDTFNSSITDPEAILNDLQSKIYNDFPEGPDIDFDIKYITKSLEDYASPAMYFVPQIDNNSQNSIYINSKRTGSDSLYTTLAHEGFPGHMYQINYFASSNPDPIRNLIAPSAYTEGWATYCEMYSYMYEDTELNNLMLNALAQANYAIILCLYAKTDIGINYYGWNTDDVYNYIKEFGYNDASVASEMYYSIISEPGNYCKYTLGYIGFSELKTTAMNTLGSSFNIKDFHKFLLDMGPVTFDILENRLKIWMDNESYSFADCDSIAA